MAQINFKHGFQRIFLIICIIIIPTGGIISWHDALSDINEFKKNNIQLQCIKEIPRSSYDVEFGHIFKKDTVP
ncbi:MAG: hypothetical protein KAQ92_02580, partial [Candidatus Aenigmarchaeota archaeon]|nr:hypothetical protein [Candidatus Aenigmarchaeota archaeon]